MTRSLLQLSNVSKRYWLQRASLNVMLECALGSVGEQLAKATTPDGELMAVRDIGFTLQQGEVLGLIGRNGAGKSTLLKLIAGVTPPTRGHIERKGRLTSLINLGASFHPDLTGRENLLFTAALRGVSQHRAQQLMEPIIDFAELGDFLDQPVRRYSTGMVVRLGFSVALHSDPEILLLDEVLAVGDVAFQAKCMQAVQRVRDEGCALIFVSHSMFHLAQVATRTLVLDHGKSVFVGDTKHAIEFYEQRMLSPQHEAATLDHGQVQVEQFEIKDQQGRAIQECPRGDTPVFSFRVRSVAPLAKFHLIVGMNRADGIEVCNFNSHTDDVTFSHDGEWTQVHIDVPALKMAAGQYTIGVCAWSHDFTTQLLAKDLGLLTVTDPYFGRHTGVYHEPARWRVEAP